jgi:hypothetical protein
LDKRIELDLWYIKHWSIWLDIKIIISTVYVVIKGEGLYAEKDRRKSWRDLILIGLLGNMKNFI